MTKIEKIKEPGKVKTKKIPMNAIERFLWWKKTFFMTYGIMISLLIVPIMAYRRGMIILGIRMSIIFYAFLMIIYTMGDRITKKKDIEFLEKEGYKTKINPKWWHNIIKGLFLALRIYVIYLLIITWMMTYG